MKWHFNTMVYPHLAFAVWQYWDERFSRYWIGRHGPIEWPPRSPDLIHIDFTLCGPLKSREYATPLEMLNVNELFKNTDY